MSARSRPHRGKTGKGGCTGKESGGARQRSRHTAVPTGMGIVLAILMVPHNRPGKAQRPPRRPGPQRSR
eukprot:9865179-Alexandrium_andersonii.AAC.1